MYSDVHRDVYKCSDVQVVCMVIFMQVNVLVDVWSCDLVHTMMMLFTMMMIVYRTVCVAVIRLTWQ